jgi:predicted porin
MYGLIDQSLATASTKNSGTGAETTQNSIKNGVSNGSRIGFKGTEDLGGGLKADFLVETNFSVADTATEGTGGSYATGQTFVGLSGSFGSVKLGAPNSPTLTTQGGRAGSFGTKDGGRAAMSANGYTTLMGLAITRLDGAIGYTSPNFSGFSFGLLYAPKSDDATTPAAGALSDVGLFYNNGPISAGVSKFAREIGAGDTTTTAVTSKNDLTSYYVTYDFKFAKFGLGGHTYKASNAAGADTADNAGMNALAEVPLSPALALTVNYQRLDDKLTANADSTMTAVGAQYSLSKRSMVYARYINQTADNAAGATIEKANRMLVGLRHNF